MKPIHIMRFAPADFLLDGFVRGLLRRRDYRTFTLYTLALFTSHYQGGDLPADLAQLADALGMDARDVPGALERCVEAGKLRSEDGRIYHKRVVAEVAQERAYRAEQAELGRRGGIASGVSRGKGTLGAREGYPSETLKGASKPASAVPVPVPTPSPSPLPLPPPAPFPGEGAREREDARKSLRETLARTVEETHLPADVLLARHSRTPTGSTITNLEAPKLSAAWMRATEQRLNGFRLAFDDGKPKLTRAEEATLARRARMRQDEWLPDQTGEGKP